MFIGKNLKDFLRVDNKEVAGGKRKKSIQEKIEVPLT